MIHAYRIVFLNGRSQGNVEWHPFPSTAIDLMCTRGHYQTSSHVALLYGPSMVGDLFDTIDRKPIAMLRPKVLSSSAKRFPYDENRHPDPSAMKGRY